MTWAEVLLTVLGSAGLSAVVVKLLNRGVDNATADKIRAEAREVAMKAAGAELDILRQVIADVRASERGIKDRLDKLEERERHMLTRAAVHEAWDQLAFGFIAGHDASFPPPPPLRPPHPDIASTEDPDDN
jgi:hypothetical protein